MYNERNARAWDMIYKNEENTALLKIYYGVVEYLNKQRKLLGMIEDHEITLAVFEEAYGKSDVFLRERHLLHVVEDDLLENPRLLANAIARFAERC